MARGVQIENHFCPIPSQTGMQRRLRKGLYVLTSIGLETLCPRCNETWPADTEFFHSQPGSATGLCSWCKACRLEWHAQRIATEQHAEAA